MESGRWGHSAVIIIDPPPLRQEGVGSATRTHASVPSKKRTLIRGGIKERHRCLPVGAGPVYVDRQTSMTSVRQIMEDGRPSVDDDLIDIPATGKGKGKVPGSV